MSSRSAGTSVDVPARERYVLTAVFGSLIVAAFVSQASTMAATLGWIAYPLVGATGIASFLLARGAWLHLTAELQAHVRRREHVEGTNTD